MKLFKTTLIVLSDYNPEVVGISHADLMHDALEGGAYCFDSTVEEIDCKDLEGEGVKEFFNCLEG